MKLPLQGHARGLRAIVVALTLSWLSACASSTPHTASVGPASNTITTAPSGSVVETESRPLRRCDEEHVTAAEPSEGLALALAPHRPWPALGARERGLLIPMRTRWGLLMQWTPMMGQLIFSQRLDGYVFASRGTNPWVLYFESSGEGVNFIRNWQRPLPDGTVAPFSAASFGPSNPNRWSLTRAAYVVEVEVQRGAGSASDLHFVATDVRVLDRTPELPLDPERALDEARDCFDALVASTGPEQTAALARAASRASDLFDGDGWEPEVAQTVDAYSPSFDPESQRLRVVFVRRVVHSRTRRETRIASSNCPPGAPCMRPREETLVTTRGYAIDLAEELEFDADGRRVMTRAHGPVVVTTEALVRGGLVREPRAE